MILFFYKNIKNFQHSREILSAFDKLNKIQSKFETLGNITPNFAKLRNNWFNIANYVKVEFQN